MSGCPRRNRRDTQFATLRIASFRREFVDRACPERSRRESPRHTALRLFFVVCELEVKIDDSWPALKRLLSPPGIKLWNPSTKSIQGRRGPYLTLVQ